MIIYYGLWIIVDNHLGHNQNEVNYQTFLGFIYMLKKDFVFKYLEIK